MGSFITTPESLQTKESIEHEANRLLHSYSYLVKGISEKGTISNVDVMKQSLIHQQWYMVYPLLHNSKKAYYKNKFEDYFSDFEHWKHTGLSKIQELEEKLLN